MRVLFTTFCCAPHPGAESWPAWAALPGGEQFRMFRESVRRVEKHAEFVILTDLDTPFDFHYDDTRIERRPTNQHELMLERTRRQARFLAEEPLTCPVVFADTDMLLVSPISPVFEQDFDIALTVRSKADMPINGGLVLANSKRPSKTRAFFHDLLSIMEDHALGEWREWYGDQHALARLLKHVAIMDEIGNVVECHGCRFLLLDANKYNFTPKTRRPRLTQDLRDITLYHFKGEYRQYMPFFWEKRIKPRLISHAKPRMSWLAAGLTLEIRRKRMKKIVKADKRRLRLKGQ